MNSIIKKLESDKIKINWNKNPIKMDLFLSFLNIPTDISNNHSGRDMGWTLRTNTEYELHIEGGIVGGVNYIDAIKYGKNLHNPYNNYVNPFYLFEIMTDEGRDFFINYYKDEINKIRENSKDSIVRYKDMIKKERLLLDEIECLFSLSL